MNLTSLRKSYSKLIGSFREAGVVLSESQQENLDSFMLMLEKKMVEVKENAVRETTDKLEAEYKKVFESVLSHMQENHDISLKVSEKTTEEKVTKRISEAVDNYLDMYMEEVLPKKTIVDYERMKKLESVQESLRNVLFFNDASIAAKKTELENEFKNEKTILESKISELTKKLSESTKEKRAMDTKIDMENAKVMLESMTKDLPEREAEMVRENLKDASTSEIKMKFRSVLESARKNLQEEINLSKKDELPAKKTEEEKPVEVKPEEGEKSLDEAINEVLGDGESKNIDDEAGEALSGAETDEIPESTKYPDMVTESVDEGVMMNWIRLAKGSLS